MSKNQGTGRHRHKGRAIVAVLAAFMVAPSTTAADNATLFVTPSICQDPKDAINYHWASNKYGASSLFFMKNDGSVAPVTAHTGSFDDHDEVYIVAHGNVGIIGAFAAADFAKHFMAAHPKPPSTAYFDSCFAADATKGHSNLRIFDDTYKAAKKLVKKIEGPAGACQLVGNGSDDLTKAVNKQGATQSNPAEFNQIVENIMAVWTKGNYSGTGKSYAAACKELQESFDAAKLLAFVNTTFATFTNTPKEPIATTINYLELIKLNAGGKDLIICGGDHGNCP
jgi:hypothetical protein